MLAGSVSVGLVGVLVEHSDCVQGNFQAHQIAISCASGGPNPGLPDEEESNSTSPRQRLIVDMARTAALKWTDRLRTQLRDARGSERKIILEREACGLVLNADIAVLCAELLWTEGVDIRKDSSAWAQIETLAKRAEQVKRTDQLGDPKHFRALLFLTRTWGLDKVDRYQWRTAGRPLVEELRRLARSCPEWSIAVKAVNAAMLARHIDDVQTEERSGRRIGGFHGNDNIKDESCPISKPDIALAILWCENGISIGGCREGQAPRRWRRQYAFAPPEPDIPKHLARQVLQWTQVDGLFQSPPLARAPMIAVEAERRGRLVSVDELGLLVPRHLECAPLRQKRERYVTWCQEQHAPQCRRSLPSPRQPGITAIIALTAEGHDSRPTVLTDAEHAIALFRSFDGHGTALATPLEAHPASRRTSVSRSASSLLASTPSSECANVQDGSGGANDPEHIHSLRNPTSRSSGSLSEQHDTVTTASRQRLHAVGVVEQVCNEGRTNEQAITALQPDFKASDAIQNTDTHPRDGAPVFDGTRQVYTQTERSGRTPPLRTFSLPFEPYTEACDTCEVGRSGFTTGNGDTGRGVIDAVAVPPDESSDGVPEGAEATVYADDGLAFDIAGIAAQTLVGCAATADTTSNEIVPKTTSEIADTTNSVTPSGVPNTTSMDCPICKEQCIAGYVPPCFEDSEARRKLFAMLHETQLLTEKCCKMRTRNNKVLRAWTHNIRVAKIHYEPRHLGTSNCTKEDAEVWCMDVETFKGYAAQGFVFVVPVLVKEQFKDSLDYTKARCAADLADALGKRKINVRSSAGKQHMDVDSKELRQRLLRPNPSQRAINVLDLAPLAKAEKPYFTRLPRYRLLDRLVDRCRAVAKQTDAVPFDVGSPSVNRKNS